MVTFAGVTYTNGAVPSSLLAPLDAQPEATLRRDAAEAWNRARADVLEQTGVALSVRGWNRTLAEQERFFFERYKVQWAGGGLYNDVRWYKGKRYVRFGKSAAAIPGTSNHGLGLAVDVVDFGTVGDFSNPRRVMVMPILAKHGWTETEGRGSIQEPWHLVWNPAMDTHPVPLVNNGGSTMAPVNTLEEEMILIRQNQAGEGFGRVVFVVGNRVIGVTPYEYGALQKVAPEVNVSKTFFDRIIKDQDVVL